MLQNLEGSQHGSPKILGRCICGRCLDGGTTVRADNPSEHWQTSERPPVDVRSA
jgi:hypothetical protein